MTTMKNDEAIKKACEYSDAPEKLRTWLDEFDFDFEIDGLRKYWPDDAEKRAALSVQIIRKKDNRKIEFEFGMSIRDSNILYIDDYIKSGKWRTRKNTPQMNDTAGKLIYNAEKRSGYVGNLRMSESYKKARQEILDGVLYSILCSIRVDFFTPLIFEDFCAEFGYDDDSRKAWETWQKCIIHVQKLSRIFCVDNMDFLST